MKTPSSTVSPQDTVSTVIDLMIKENVGAIVVLEEKRPVGIITEKDLLGKVIKSKKNFEQILVKDIMSKPVVAIEAQQPIRDALNIMHEHDLKRLIITKNGSFTGLTTERRLLETAHGLYAMKNIDRLKSIPDEDSDKIRIAYVSTYPPRQCGIATYTKELVDAISTIGVLRPVEILDSPFEVLPIRDELPPEATAQEFQKFMRFYVGRHQIRAGDHGDAACVLPVFAQLVE